MLLLYYIAAHTKGKFTSSNNSTIISDLFKEPMTVVNAYATLISRLRSTFKCCDIYLLKAAFINQAHTPDGVKLDKSTKDEIISAKSSDDLLLAIAECSYSNWLNTTLLEVMACCSCAPGATETIKQYKQFIGAKKLKEVLPRQLHLASKRARYITAVCAIINMHSDEITVADFLRSFYYNKEIIFDLAKGILNVKHIKRGGLKG